MATRSMIIIGAGIAGLAVGCYAAMNGYFTQIFELHGVPGGLSTSWKRGGYTMDTGLRFIEGANSNSSQNQLWRELGVAQDREFIVPEYSTQVIDRDNRQMVLYSDPEQLENHLKSISPEDTPVIKDFISAIRQLSTVRASLDTPDSFLKNLQRSIQKYPQVKTARKWAAISMGDFSRRFKHPFLQKSFEMLYEGLPETPALALLQTHSLLAARNAGYPVGGSLELARAVEKRYLDLGGNIHYFSRVNKILVEDSAAIGVQLENGDTFFADIVVSASDGHSTIFDLLEGRYLGSQVQGYYSQLPVSRSIVQVSLGLRHDLNTIPSSAIYTLPEPIQLSGESRKSLAFWHLAGDPTLGPPGKAVMTTQIPARYEYWKDLAATPAAYTAEKSKTATLILEQLNQLYPGIQQDVEITNVATPTTIERYTANWKGSTYGWAISAPGLALVLRGGMGRTLPGLKNFYFVGQWVEPGGGVFPAALSARNLVQRLVFQARLPFETTEASPVARISSMFGSIQH
jgi:phytoene dehydrogenase-like protein